MKTGMMTGSALTGIVQKKHGSLTEECIAKERAGRVEMKSDDRFFWIFLVVVAIFALSITVLKIWG